MARYLVAWEIDYEGEGDPEAAARWAWDKDGNETKIDLAELDEARLESSISSVGRAAQADRGGSRFASIAEPDETIPYAEVPLTRIWLARFRPFEADRTDPAVYGDRPRVRATEAISLASRRFIGVDLGNPFTPIQQ